MDEIEQVSRILDGQGGWRNTLDFIWLVLGPVLFFTLYGAYRWLHRNPHNQDRPPFAFFFSVQPEDSETELGTQLASMAVAEAKSENAFIHQPWGPVERVATVMGHFNGTWAIAGGWALDLFLGELTRPHDDLDVAVLRREQELLAEFLIGWHPKYAIPGASSSRQPWMPGEWLEAPVHAIHTNPPQSDLDSLEFLLNEVEHDVWVYRRDARISLPMERAILPGRGDVPCLAPEIVLLYKSKRPRIKDERDFELVLGAMSFEQQQWLRDALQLVDPQHHWLVKF